MRVGILHGAGYTGRELCRLVLGHPNLDLQAVTTRTFAGQPLWNVHAGLRGQTDLTFIAPDEVRADELDAVFVAAEHGQGAVTAAKLLDSGFEGYVVDLSADFRLPQASDYESRYDREHPAPHLAGTFAYGMADLNAPYPEGTRRVANPGCFATGLSLALKGVDGPGLQASVTALTGASGSGARPKATTHFPDRDGNVRAYKVFAHQHMAEVLQLLSPDASVDFVPVSGPWTRGIWGTVHVQSQAPQQVAERFQALYADRPLVRLWSDRLPELRWAVNTPFCDIGWVQKGDSLVIGFAIDNLLKGAASQAVHNLNLIAGLGETAGLLPAEGGA